MSNEWFEGQYAGRWAITRDEYKYWRLRDYATYAVATDINMIHDFMQSNVFHAALYNNKSWNDKVKLFNNYYSSSGKSTNYVYGNGNSNYSFPYDMPEIYVVTHYMKALDNLHGTRSYTTAGGSSITLYEKDNEFINVSDLNSLQHKYWAKYWWNAAGQSLDYSKKGFADDFYWKNSSTKYYNVKNNQAENGKQKSSSTQSYVLGDWYTTDQSKAFGSNITTYFQVYYLTSQAPNFESTLMEMAVFARANAKVAADRRPRAFFPNAIIKTDQIYYNIPMNNKTHIPSCVTGSKNLYMANPDGKKNASSYGFK